MSYSLVDNLMAFREGFLQFNLEPPAAIVLPDRETGFKVLSQIQRELALLDEGRDLRKYLTLYDGSIWCQIEFMGIKIAWPDSNIQPPPPPYPALNFRVKKS